MSPRMEVPQHVRYDTTLSVVVPHDFSREKAIAALKHDRPCFLGMFPKVKLRPGPREVHLIRPSGSKSLGEVLQAINLEGNMKPDPLEMALILADQHPDYGIESGIAFLAFLWSEGEKVNTTFFPYLSLRNGRYVLRVRSNQGKRDPGWQIGVSAPSRLAFDPRTEAEQVETATSWIQLWEGKLAAA